MNIKQTLIGLVAIIGVTLLFVSTPLYAQTECGGVSTSIIYCEQGGGETVEDTGIWGILLLIINIMTAGVGVLAVAGIVYGAILYTSAGGTPDNVKKAKTVITNVVIGLLAYFAMFAILQYLIPGGVFKV